MRCVGVRFELFVSNIEQAVRFYEVALGCVVRRDASGYVSLHNGGLAIGLGLRRDLAPDHHLGRVDNTAHPPGLGIELVVEVDDVDAHYERAQRGIGGVGGRLEPIQDREWGLRDFRLIDPDGYYVRVTSQRGR